MNRSILACAALALPCVAAWTSPQDDAPKKKEIDALIDEYFELPWTTRAGIDRQDEILARLELVEPLSSKDAASWRKKLGKLWEKGPEIEAKGRNWFFEDEEQGLYIIGGKNKRPEGLFLGMHGGGLNSGDAGNSHASFTSAAKDRDWVGVFPQVLEKTEHGWTDSGTEEFVIELVQRARRTFGIDANRVYFGGHSMGGYGSWTLGARHADMVAGLAPSAGAPTPYMKGSEVQDIVEGIVPNLRNVAMVIYQSDDDPRVPPAPNRKAVERMAEAKERWGGYDYEYWEVSGRGHDLPPGGGKALLEKIGDKVREPRPARVVWQPTKFWKRHFYWLFWTEPATNALVVADLDREANAVHVTCDKSPKGLSVLLDDALLDLSREVVVTCNDEEVYRGLPARSLATLLMTGVRGDPDLTFDVRIPLAP